MAGLLTANLLRRYSPVVLEAQVALPDNHGALLRFRSDAVARATGQTFREVRVLKGIWYKDKLYSSSNMRFSNMYALKIGEEVLNRSILDLAPVTRYIAPETFIADMAVGINIEFNRKIDHRALNYYLGGQIANVPHKRYEEIPQTYRHMIISTLPMPTLMELIGWREVPEFRYKPIWSFKAAILAPRVNVYQTLYYPDPEAGKYYRASVTGNTLIIEYSVEPTQGDLEADVIEVLNNFGIWGPIDLVSDDIPKYQKYGKLLPIDERIRKAFIYGMSNEYGIYSVGRFATWRQILMDDVVEDVNQVSEFILDRDQYIRHLQQSIK